MIHQSPTERGSAFFLILIGIALFAGLSYAVFNGSRQSASGLTRDQARVAANEIASYANTIQNAFQKLRLRGCQLNQLSVRDTNELSWSTYTNSSAPADGSCSIYHLSGGAVVNQRPQENWFVPEASNKFWSYNARIAVGGVGSEDAELLFVASGLQKELCVALNGIYGVESVDGDAPPIIYFDNLGFNGVFPDPATQEITDEPITGKSGFCLKDSDDLYKFNAVMIAR